MTQSDSSSSTNRTHSTSPTHRWQGGRWSRLCLKELREILRDRRTLITLVLMPLLVYPILSMVFQRSLISAWSTASQQKLIIAVTSEQTGSLIKDNLRVGNAYLRAERGDGPPKNRSGNESNDDEPNSQAASGDDSNSAKPDANKVGDTKDNGNQPGGINLNQLVPGSQDIETIEFMVVPDLEQCVRAEVADIGVLGPNETDHGQIELIHRQGSSLSRRALEFIEDRLRAVNELVLRGRLKDSGISARLAFRPSRRTLIVETQDTTLSTIVPMILILMTVTGAVYPAIDLTAGERERGTLEMLMASPVPRLKLLLAKYVAVVTVAFLTALVNLTAMTITLSATGLSEILFGEAGLSLGRISQILALLILFAAFFSAVLLALTSFARSFKEAQAYLIPLMLLSLGPGIVSLLPGLQLGGLLAITPISNMVLLARDICGGGADPLMATVVILSTGMYTLAAVGVAAKIFGADAVMTGGAADFKSLFAAAPGDHRVSSVSGALMCLSVLFPVYFVLSNGLGQLSDLSISVRLVLAGVATSLLFGVIPLLAAKLQKLDLQQSFQILKTSFPAFSVAVLLGFTVWPLAHEIVLFTEWLGLNSIGAAQIAASSKLLDQLRTASPFLILLGMAIAPAIFEELFFRGYLFSALKSATNAKTTIITSAILFGAFHVISKSSLSIERLLPSTFMGLILGWLCYRCGSVLPGMLLHACHNGLLVMLAFYQKELSAMGIGMEEEAHLPAAWLGMSLFSLLFGIAFIAWLPSAQRKPTS